MTLKFISKSTEFRIQKNLDCWDSETRKNPDFLGTWMMIYHSLTNSGGIEVGGQMDAMKSILDIVGLRR